ncbi:MAG: polysaccharide biosynthesis C-terminal domain-containing protein [Thermoplasmata archaeon]
MSPGSLVESEDVAPPTGPGEATPPEARWSLTINSATVFLAGVTIQLIGFIGSLFVYRAFGTNTADQALYGTVQLFLLIASTINTLGDLRLGAGYQLFLARGKPATANTGTYLLLRFILVGICGALVLTVSPLSFGGSILAPTPYSLEVLGVFMVLPLLWTFETLYQNYYIGIGNSVRSQYPGLVEVIVRTPLLIFAAFAFPTLLGLAGAYLAGTIGAAIFCIPAIVPLVRRYRRSEARLLFRYSWPLLGALGLATMVGSLIPFFVNYSLGSAALTYFNLANGFRVLALALPAAITTPLFPYIAALHKRSQYHQIRDGIWTALRYSSLLLIPGVVLLAVYRVDVITITVGGNYVVPSATPLAILVLATVPASLGLIIGTGLAAIGWRRLELYLTAAQISVLFGLAFALMPPYGILPASRGLDSAAIAVLGSSCVALALNAYFMHRLMAVRLFPKSILAIAAAAVLAFFAISRANRFFPTFLDSAAAQLAIGIVVGAVVYFLAVALLGELTKEDIYRIGRSMALPDPLLRFTARLCWRTSSPHVVSPVNVADVPGLTGGYIPEEDDADRSPDAPLPPGR